VGDQVDRVSQDGKLKSPFQKLVSQRLSPINSSDGFNLS
jgi:hypothetical protein